MRNNSENHSFEEKNSAVWALGQFADQKALPFLHEIEKAIKWCKRGNLTSWMYRNIEK